MFRGRRVDRKESGAALGETVRKWAIGPTSVLNYRRAGTKPIDAGIAGSVAEGQVAKEEASAEGVFFADGEKVCAKQESRNRENSAVATRSQAASELCVPSSTAG